MGHLVWKSSFKKASSFPNDCGMSSYWSILDLINQEEEMWGETVSVWRLNMRI